MKTQERIRIYRFHDLVALSFDDTETLYIEPDNAKALARELKRFADECNKCNRDTKWFSARIIQKGKATNELDGKSRPIILP